MQSFIGFMELVSAILGAMGLAMGLEWLALSGLLRLTPRQDARIHRIQASHGRHTL
jgi:hypothetical protein